MILQCNPWFELDTPDGPAYGIFYEVPSDGLDTQWHCVIRRTGDLVCYRSSKCKLAVNVTMGIRVSSPSLYDAIGAQRKEDQK